ncbi:MULTISPECIES: hypothetical protein [Aeromonas]|uniref:hypothetical protein n=1 Tax=Aeromonas TaxID=642 RepID=UPI00372D2635
MDSFIEFAFGVMNDHMGMAILLFLLFFFVKLIFLKRHIYSLFDPLLFFLVFNSFSFVTVFFVSYFKYDYFAFYDFLLFNVLFFLPALFIKPINFDLYKASFSSSISKNGYLFYNIMAVFFILPTIIMWVSRGVPLFSENATDAKVLFYAGGFGVVRYIHFILPLYVFFVGMLFILDSNANKQLNIISKISLIFILLFVFLFFVTSGSKSALLPLIFCLAFANECYRGTRLYFIIKKLLIMLFMLAIGLVFLVLFLSGLSESSDVMNLLFTSLGVRFLASGDFFFFWYEYGLNENYNPSFSFWGYILQPLLAMLGVTTHEYPLGAVIMNEATGYPLSSFGPNGQLPVVLDLAWGPIKYLGAFFAGFSVFLLRYKSFYLMKRTGGGGAILFCLVFFSATVIYTDIAYFFSMLYSFLLLFAPVYIIFNILSFGFKKTVDMVR